MGALRISSRNWSRALPLVGAALLAGWAGAAPAAERSCDSPPHRAFDFWVGEWVVSQPDGREAGHNRIEREQGGCVLVERWHGVRGSTGISLNFYDPAAEVWRQVWISPQTQIDVSGGLVDGSMVLEGTITYLEDARTHPFRGTWTPLDDGRVRQFFEEAPEPGHWVPWFEGFYRRTDADSGS